MIRRTDQPSITPERRHLAYAVCRVEWRGEVVECELEVSDGAIGSVIQSLLNQAFEQVSGELASLVEQRAIAVEQTRIEIPTVAQTVDVLSLELSDLPARGGQCRAVVVRQKEHAEVREPCGYQLGTIGEWTSCPNYNNHLQAETMVGEDEGTVEVPEPTTLKQRLAEAYIDRFGTAPPETMTTESMRAALRRP